MPNIASEILLILAEMFFHYLLSQLHIPSVSWLFFPAYSSRKSSLAFYTCIGVPETDSHMVLDSP